MVSIDLSKYDFGVLAKKYEGFIKELNEFEFAQLHEIASAFDTFCKKNSLPSRWSNECREIFTILHSLGYQTKFFASASGAHFDILETP